jgi:hypothetical protein
MRIGSVRLLGAMVFAAVLAPGFASAYTGFCGSYKQVSSNAGYCATCTLQIADNPEIQKYFIESNNGWSAEATWVEGDDSVAEGTGKWKKSSGGAYGGKRFDISLTQQRRILTMTMTMRDRSLGTVEAKYKCTDY